MKNPWVLVILFLCYSNSVFSQEKIANTTQKIKQNDMSNKTPEEWRKILNDLPSDLDLEGELLVLLLNKGGSKNDKDIYGNNKPNDSDRVEFKKIEEDTKRKNKEELKKLRKKKKVLEEKLLNEIRKLTKGEK